MASSFNVDGSHVLLEINDIPIPCNSVTITHNVTPALSARGSIPPRGQGALSIEIPFPDAIIAAASSQFNPVQRDSLIPPIDALHICADFLDSELDTESLEGLHEVVQMLRLMADVKEGATNGV